MSENAERPRWEDFDSDEEYQEALIEHKIDKRERAAQEKQEREREAEAKQQAESAFRERVLTTNESGQAKYDDYQDVISSFPPGVMNRDLAETVIETDSPEDVAYHFGKNPSEAERISRLSPVKKAIELGKLETRLALSKNKTTQAPPPIKPIKGTEKPEIDPDSLSTDEWIRLRNEGKI